MTKPPVPFLLAAMLVSACDDSSDDPPVDGSHCALVVVSSDYLSTSVSLLNADGTPCAQDVITSGSKRPGLLTALSGDVVLPSTPSARGVLLLDRYPNGVLTQLGLSPVGVTAQARLSPGFAGNPQDALELDGFLLVSRLESIPEGGDGSDLVLLDQTLSVSARVDLSPHADPGFDPMPTRLVEVGDYIWVGLTHMSRGDFAQTGPGRVLGLSHDLQIRARVDVTDLTNCGSVAASDHAIWALCAGHFRADLGQRRARGGLVRIPLPGPKDDVTGLTPDFIARASTLGPMAFSFAPTSDEAAAVVLLGDLVTKAPDRLVIVHTDGRVEPLAESSPFSLSGLLYLPEQSLLLAADGDAFHPQLLRFDLSSPNARVLEPVSVSATGLPPRHLGRIRP